MEYRAEAGAAPPEDARREGFLLGKIGRQVADAHVPARPGDGGLAEGLLHAGGGEVHRPDLPALRIQSAGYAGRDRPRPSVFEKTGKRGLCLTEEIGSIGTGYFR